MLDTDLQFALCRASVRAGHDTHHVNAAMQYTIAAAVAPICSGGTHTDDIFMWLDPGLKHPGVRLKTLSLSDVSPTRHREVGSVRGSRV